MKKLLFLFVSIILISACEDDSDVSPQLEGAWQLSEVLNDPGDGSGTFQPADSDQSIEFFADGTFKSPGTFCTTTLALLTESTGTYDKARSVLIVDDCFLNEVQIEYPYKMEDGNLIIEFMCIERCAKKYQKR